jgi:hypothetical protein
MTRRLERKAMREAAAMVKAFVESDTGKEIRETVRQFSESDIAKKIREAAKSFPAVDRSAVIAAAEATAAWAGMQDTEDEVAAPAPLPRKKGGGAPALHDWPGAKQAAADHIKKNGLPPVRQRLIEVVRNWFGEGAPDDREIRRMVDQFYPQKQKVGKLPPKVGKPTSKVGKLPR